MTELKTSAIKVTHKETFGGPLPGAPSAKSDLPHEDGIKLLDEAVAYCEKGAYTQALNYFDRARTFFSAPQYLSWLTYLQHERAIAYAGLEDYKTSYNEYEQAERGYMTLMDYKGLSLLLIHRSETCFKAKNPSEGYGYLRLAEYLVEKMHTEALKSYLYSSLGLYLFNSGRFYDAAQYYKLALNREDPHSYNAAWYKSKLGIAYESIFVMDAAEQYYREAYTQFAELKEYRELTEVMGRLSRIYTMQGREDAAKEQEIPYGTKELFMNPEIPNSQLICKTKVHDNLSFIFSNIDKLSDERDINRRAIAYDHLHNALSDRIREYDVVIIDAPASTNNIALNALYAADLIILPIQCENLAIKSMKRFLMAFQEFQLRVKDKELKIAGILLTMFDKNIEIHRKIARQLYHALSNSVFQTIIPRHESILNSSAGGQSVIVHQLNSIGAVAYIHLMNEVLERHKEFFNFSKKTE
ncbi:hypothetical protein CHS0354_030095 [Potamilus streckersoni]|uniref:AAA domain-containing protein n=1 Tax=Potamilus streckersoni TaxID=2493646 RepID=A0AAE0RLS2_9BIVA|nr:hypothetical protein CHS0354_030095 [Potamilus streckersoni]